MRVACCSPITSGRHARCFARLADLAIALLGRILAFSLWWPWLMAPLGFFAIAWATRRFFRGAEGSGIPQTIFALRTDSGEAGLRLLKVHVVLGRIFLAAAFNTPLAGVVFAIEELSKSFEERASGTALTTVILAGVVAIALVGNYTYFGQPVVTAAVPAFAPITWCIAITSGISGGMFSRVTLASVSRLTGCLGRLRRRFPALFAGLCGLAVAATGSLSGGLTYGSGYRQARSVLEAHVHLPWLYAPARALAILLSYLSGIPAGILAPSLSAGAGIGQSTADFFGYAPVPFAILGMCGYLAGVTQAPLTALVIVTEMTSQHAMVLPLMITAAVATAVSRLLSPPLYQTLARHYAE